jgi:ribonuclease Z
MLSVTFLGTSAARPTVERGVASIAVQREGETFLFDCGEGTQRQMMRYGVSFALSEIFVTHYHADHFLGILGLLRTLGLQGREEPFTLYGPRGAARVLGRAVELGIDRSPFPITIEEVTPGDRLERGDYVLEVFTVAHGRSAVGYAVREHQRLGRFDPDKARALGIPEGPQWGQIHRGESVEVGEGDDKRIVDPTELVGAPRSGRLLVYTGDTRPSEEVVRVADGADLLIHEATFEHEERERARDTDHSTAVEAAQVALAAGVRKLALTHLSARYSASPRVLLEEAQTVFQETVVARDGMTIEMPFRDEAADGVQEGPL